tara:strand:- start:323 stop:553 length:231 start_codon:yes stop_codon:yes gene_type:complete
MNLEEYVDVAHRNSYDVIINNKDAKNLITRDDGYFIHHPAKPVTIDILEDLKLYFSEMEEFEKCIEIIKYIDENID